MSDTGIDARPAENSSKMPEFSKFSDPCDTGEADVIAVLDASDDDWPMKLGMYCKCPVCALPIAIGHVGGQRLAMQHRERPQHQAQGSAKQMQLTKKSTRDKIKDLRASGVGKDKMPCSESIARRGHQATCQSNFRREPASNLHAPKCVQECLRARYLGISQCKL